MVSSEILGKWRRGGQSSLPSDRVRVVLYNYRCVYKSVWYTLDHCIKTIGKSYSKRTYKKVDI